MRDYRLHFAQMHLTFGKKTVLNPAEDIPMPNTSLFKSNLIAQNQHLKIHSKRWGKVLLTLPLFQALLFIRTYCFISKPRIWFAHVEITKSLLKIQQSFVAILSLYCCMSLCFGNDCRGGWAGICAWVWVCLEAEQAFALVWMLIKKIE